MGFSQGTFPREGKLDNVLVKLARVRDQEYASPHTFPELGTAEVGNPVVGGFLLWLLSSGRRLA
jgi:hypothetical protein